MGTGETTQVKDLEQSAQGSCGPLFNEGFKESPSRKDTALSCSQGNAELSALQPSPEEMEQSREVSFAQRPRREQTTMTTSVRLSLFFP